jgi:hypothetical protein
LVVERLLQVVEPACELLQVEAIAASSSAITISIHHRVLFLMVLYL